MSENVRGLFWELLEAEALMVSYYGGQTEDDRWDEYIEVVRELHKRTDMRNLVYVLERPPLAAIERMNSLGRGAPSRMAMMSSLAAMRFVGSAIHLINKDMRFFAVDELDAALDHLFCSPAEKLTVTACLDRLRGDGAPRLSVSAL